MGKSCFIPNCKTGYPSCTEKVSIFKAPQNSKQLKRWSDAIAVKNKKLTKKDHVCEKHFKDEDMLTDGLPHNAKQDTDSPDSLEKKQLVNGAIPSIFPKSPRHKLSKKRKINNVSKEQETSDAINVDDDSLSSHNHDSNIMKVEIPTVMSAKELFNMIHLGEIRPTLPNMTWAIHCTDVPDRSIVVSQLVMHANNLGLMPLYIKQLVFNDKFDCVFDEKLNCEVYFLGSRIVLKNNPFTFKTIREFESFVLYVNRLRLCAGGPEISQYSNVNPECAYKDPMGKWRHNLCTLEVSNENVCEYCLSLDDILRRHAQRNKQTTKPRTSGIFAKRKKIG